MPSDVSSTTTALDTITVAEFLESKLYLELAVFLRVTPRQLASRVPKRVRPSCHGTCIRAQPRGRRQRSAEAMVAVRMVISRQKAADEMAIRLWHVPPRA